MLARRIGLVAAPLLLLAATVAMAGGGSSALPGGKATAAPSHSTKKIDLATYPAKRWIVQLNGAPLATYRGGVAGYRATAAASTGASRLDATSARSRAYVSHLRSVQHAFAQRLARKLPGVRVQRTYQVVLNGLAVKMNRGQAAVARKMRGVRAVTPDIAYHLDMFSTPQQIGAPTLWGQVGGQGNAGAGVKVAIVDSGIFVRHDAAGAYTGNACFDDTGYTAPAGFPKGDTRFTNNKVIVARTYFRPGDPPIAGEDTAIQGTNTASPHGTHVAGTVACNAGTSATFGSGAVPISGVAPRAYLMNYRVFYPSQSPEDFQNANAYTVELVKAIEDAVTDGADVVSSSWGASYQNTLAWPDPMIQAADDAVDAGVVMVFANGNAGPDTATVNSPAIAPKVIGVGAVTKDAVLFPGSVSVTAPEPVPANLKNFQIGGAAFGPAATSIVAAPLIPGERVSTAATDKSLGCSLTGDVSPFPAGSLTGSIALIERGVCNFSEKVYNAQRGGAIATIIYNGAANGDAVATMGAGVHAADVTIPSWEIGRTNGVNTLAWANANPTTAQAKFDPTPSLQPNAGDVMAGFSSRGPTTDKLLKPDVSAPGVNVLSGGYGTGAFPAPFVGFGQVSGTSMATPHVAGSAALLVQLHPNWTPDQIKSALMTTATENVWTNTAKTILAGVLDRGAGRIDLTKAGNPGITLDHPSLSAGEITAGQHVDFTIEASDVSGAGGTWSVSAAKTGSAATIANFDITPGSASLTVAANGSATLGVTVSAVAAAAPGNYEGKVVLTNGGTTLHVPVWLRVLPTTPTADVLLVDDDGSNASATFPDYSTVYMNALTGLGVSFTYLNAWTQTFPSLNALHGYKVVLVFTGNNNSFNTSGFTTAALDRISEWLDSGGKLFTTGQNMAETTDNNTSFSSPSIGRSRLYHGYLGVRNDAGNAYPGAAAPRPTANGVGPFAGMTVDVSPGADGAGNQTSIEVTSPMPDNDTYEAAHTMTALLRAIGSPAQGPTAALSFGRSSEPSLNEERVEYRYRSLSMGFGLEAVNDGTAFTSRAQLTRASLNWLLDRITFDSVSVAPHKAKKKPKATKDVDLTAHVASNVGATFVQYRWDFGDGKPWATTTAGSVHHKYKKWGTYSVRIEATDSLGHRSVQHQTVVLSKH